MSMNAEHCEQLATILRWYGSYEVVKSILEMSKETAAQMHFEAVIQRDVPVIETCVERMKQNHPLRMMQG